MKMIRKWILFAAFLVAPAATAYGTLKVGGKALLTSSGKEEAGLSPGKDGVNHKNPEHLAGYAPGEEYATVTRIIDGDTIEVRFPDRRWRKSGTSASMRRRQDDPSPLNPRPSIPPSSPERR